MQNAWRDSGFEGGPQFVLPSMTPVTKRLIWINVGVFLVGWMVFLASARFDVTLKTFFGVSPQQWKSLLPPVWQLVTYGFVHSHTALFHILFNMLLLYFFGTMLEGVVGGRRFLSFFLGAVVAGGVASLVFGLLLGRDLPTIGASAGALGVLVAAATMRPNARVIFIIFPLTLRTLALILVALDAFNGVNTLAGRGSENVAYFAHLGGMAFGYLMVKRGWIWRDPLAGLQSGLEQRRARSAQDERKRVDELLDKIHREGIHSLSMRERAFLKRVSKRP